MFTSGSGWVLQKKNSVAPEESFNSVGMVSVPCSAVGRGGVHVSPPSKDS